MSELKVGDTVRVNYGADGEFIKHGGEVNTESLGGCDFLILALTSTTAVLGVPDLPSTVNYACGISELAIPKRTITLEDGTTVTLSAESYEALAKEAK